ncbi:CbrC family protein [Thaumasiovibrio subtropicus]|uniref:CbrC family protein n=1 Tax=Thaumasiovibrio subtropicus TaxID=1891207 RepID=UPI00131C6A9D|nr:CbrC family protein [Thaumasiovibrio subtropicus]
MVTFKELGMEFPLFEAPVEDAIVDGAGNCSHCKAESPVLFNEFCFSCFRSGEGSNTVDTEYGMVSKEDSLKGCTYGIPLDPNDLPDLPLIAHEVDPQFPDEHWYSVQFKPADLIELTRTPIYHTSQGEQWLFCCERPSIFLGHCSSDKLAEIAEEKKLSIEATLNSLLSHPFDDMCWLVSAIDSGLCDLYLFRCQQCSKLHAHFDMD